MANRGIKALVAWIWDWLIEHWPALSVAGVLSGMTYLAAISQWLNAYGPVAWGFAGLLGALITALIYWVYAFAAQKIAVSAFVAQVSKPADNINPLEDAFHKRRIKIQDLVDPFRREIKGKTFTDCDLIGPANLLFQSQCFVHGAGFSDCELVFVNKDFKTSTITRLNDIHITRGRIVAATLFITPAMKLAMGDLATHPEANWVNQ